MRRILIYKIWSWVLCLSFVTAYSQTKNGGAELTDDIHKSLLLPPVTALDVISAEEFAAFKSLVERRKSSHDLGLDIYKDYQSFFTRVQPKLASINERSFAWNVKTTQLKLDSASLSGENKFPASNQEYLGIEGKINTLLLEYDKLVKSHNLALAAYNKGLVNYNKGDFQAAIHDFRFTYTKELLRDHSSFYLALCFYQVFNYQEGARYHKMAEYSDAPKYYLNYYAGLNLHKMGQFDKAITYLNKCIDSDLKFYLPYYFVGSCYNQLTRYEESIMYFKKALELYPKDLGSIHLMVYSYVAMLAFDEAKKEVEKAFKLFPNHPHVWYLSGYVKYKNSEFESAIEDCKKSMALNPKDSENIMILGLAYFFNNNKAEYCSYIQRSAQMNNTTAKLFLQAHPCP